MIRQIDTHVYCGPRPKTKEDIDKLLDVGIEHFVSLETGAYESTHNDVYERAGYLFKASFPCSDFTPPSKELTLDIIDELALMSEAECCCYFHCLHGRDRTGWILAAYRIIVQGWTEEKALKEYLTHGLHWFYRPWWIPIFKARKFGVK